MRTTLEIDDDILQAAKELAAGRDSDDRARRLGSDAQGPRTGAAGSRQERRPRAPAPAGRYAAPDDETRQRVAGRAVSPIARGAPRRVALLDVNVLVALFDSDHVHHDIAHDWFADNRSAGWASCPVTENGLLRVLANPKYGSPVSALPALVDLLRKFTANSRHTFWSGAVSLGDRKRFNPSFIRGHAQITDVYLLGVAHANGGCLATFDRGIPLAAVVGARPETLAIVSATDEV